MPTHKGSYPPTTQFRAAKGRQGFVWSTWRPGRIFLLRLLWCIFITSQEFLVFKSAIRACTVKQWTSPALPTDHVLAFIGDPQLVDENTYTRRGIALALTKFYTDLYMRRNYRLLARYIPIDTILFTGDLFDGGREWQDSEWEREYRRFRRIFRDVPHARVIDSMPGNHDIGIGDGMSTAVYDRFRQHFGNTSLSIDAGAWEVVVLDTVALSSGDAEIRDHPKEFLKTWQATRSDKPKLLLTHVPLYRAANAPCGKLRESDTSIRIQKGHQYQNVLEPRVSDEIWATVKPSVIFAGDDHDYCDYRHDNGIHEINVKSFSWAMGIKRPGVQLVSLSGTRYETHLCLLPNQLELFQYYGVALLLTIIASLLLQVWQIRRKQGHILPRTNKDDSNKRILQRSNVAETLKRTIQEILNVAWIVGIYYVYMIWW